MGKKPNNRQPRLRKPWQLGDQWETYPSEVPEYTPWNPGDPNQKLQEALYGLRQGELYLCAQFKVYSEAVESDLRDREVMLNAQADRISQWEQVARGMGDAVHGIRVATDKLTCELTSLAKRLTCMEQRLLFAENSMQDLRRDISSRQPEKGSQDVFQERLCDELLRLATVLRVPELIAEGPNADGGVVQQIAAAQHVARLLRSPARSVSGISLAGSSRCPSPSPSIRG